jgi:hypothetical protein
MKAQLNRINANYAVIRFNETEFWRDDIKRHLDAAYGYYLVNLTEPTHNCSIQADYPAIALFNRFDFKEGHPYTEDEVFEMEMDVREDVAYYNEYTTVEVCAVDRGQFETEEQAEEYYRGNVHDLPLSEGEVPLVK